jgi:cardiolipin synthase
MTDESGTPEASAGRPAATADDGPTAEVEDVEPVATPGSVDSPDLPPEAEPAPPSGLQRSIAEAMDAPWREYCFDTRAVVYGNDVDLLRDGREAFPAMIEAIDSARRSVWLETYILEDDVIGRVFAEALVRAAQRHVSCMLLYDAVGSPLLSLEFLEAMTQAGVKLAEFRPLSARLPFRVLWRRDHRKLLVVDDRVAFVGGINIHAQAAPVEYGGQGWHDFAVRVRGPAVAPLSRLFVESWGIAQRRRLRRRERRALAARPAATPQGDIPVQVVATDNVRGRWSIRRSLLYAISRARRTVLIANAYFVPDPGVVRALTGAAQRGVDVRLLVPERSDVPVVDYVRGAFYDKLLAAGVRIHHWETSVLHAKVAVVDETWAMVGSYNLDWMSLLRLHEVVVAVLDPGFTARLTSELRADIDVSLEITSEHWKRRPFWRRWFERLLYTFRRYL